MASNRLTPVSSRATMRERAMAFQQRMMAARAFLFGRRGSYLRVFNSNSQDARQVLRDLQRFCRANHSTYGKDPYLSARLDGRREVWLRIQHHLKLDDETLWRLYGGAPIQNTTDQTDDNQEENES